MRLALRVRLPGFSLPYIHRGAGEFAASCYSPLGGEGQLHPGGATLKQVEFINPKTSLKPATLNVPTNIDA